MSIPLGLALNPEVNKCLDVRTSGVSTSRPTYPARGLLRYEHDLQSWIFYDGTTWQPFEEKLFPDTPSDHYVQSPVGGITHGTTVAELKQKSVTQLLTELLSIGPAPEIFLSLQGVSLSYTNSSEEHLVGSTASVTIRLHLNRGRWAGGNLLFEPALGALQDGAQWGGGLDLVATDADLYLTFESSVPFVHTFNQLQDVRLPSTGSISLDAGATYENNYNTQYQANARSFTSVSNAPYLRAYLPAYKNSIALPERVYTSTLYVEVSSHESDELVEVPFLAGAVSQYEPFGAGDPWKTLDPVDYEITQVDKTFGDVTVQYSVVQLLFTRGARDIRIYKNLGR